MFDRVLLMMLAFVVYSSSTICSKLASQQEFLSFPYICCLLGVVAALAVYAALWQIILEFMDLGKAFLCKSITIVFILVFSYFCFSETITLCTIIGIFFIILGLVVLAWKQ